MVITIYVFVNTSFLKIEKGIRVHFRKAWEIQIHSISVFEAIRWYAQCIFEYDNIL